MRLQYSLRSEKQLLRMVQALDLRAPYALGHFQTVSRYAVMIAQEMRLPSSMVVTMRKAGLLHDIGKFWIPEDILTKPERLTEQEFTLIKQHATIGAEVLMGFPSLEAIVPLIRYHHERYDGKGYPHGLSGEDIPLGARILNVADTVEAMASDRPYKRGFAAKKILSILSEESNLQFDQQVVQAFMRGIHKQGIEIISNPGQALGSPVADPESFRVLSTSLTEWLQFHRTCFTNESPRQHQRRIDEKQPA